MDFIVCPIRNFECSDYNEPIEIKQDDTLLFYLFYQEMGLINVLNSYMYKETFGIDCLSYFKNNFICYAHSENIPIEKIKIIMNNFYCNCQLLSNALWFIKDNAVTPYFTTFSSTQQIQPNILRKGVYYTSSIGMFDKVNFSKDELKRAIEWYGILDDFLLKKEASSINVSDNLTNMSNYMSLDVPSFQRAFYYLDDARKTDFLPSKIASYISILECITAVKGENVQKVSQRVSYFIGNNFDERLKLFDDIKVIYDFRSSYVHGSQITEKKHVILPEICKRADEIVRQVLSKIFTKHKDLNYMNKKDKNNPNSKSNEDVDRWFNELTFGRE